VGFCGFAQPGLTGVFTSVKTGCRQNLPTLVKRQATWNNIENLLWFVGPFDLISTIFENLLNNIVALCSHITCTKFHQNQTNIHISDVKQTGINRRLFVKPLIDYRAKWTTYCKQQCLTWHATMCTFCARRRRHQRGGKRQRLICASASSMATEWRCSWRQLTHCL